MRATDRCPAASVGEAPPPAPTLPSTFPSALPITTTRSNTMTTTIELIGARGGQGTTTVASVLALLLAGHQPTTLATDDPTAAAALLGVPLPLEDEWAQVTPTLRLNPRGVTANDGAAVAVLDRGRESPD